MNILAERYKYQNDRDKNNESTSENNQQSFKRPKIIQPRNLPILDITACDEDNQEQIKGLSAEIVLLKELYALLQKYDSINTNDFIQNKDFILQEIAKVQYSSLAYDMDTL